MKLIFPEYGWLETISQSFYHTNERLQCKPHNKFPHYLLSNGLAEKYVQIVKNLFYKAQEEVVDLYKSLMIYRYTPLSSQLQLPMQILQSRIVKQEKKYKAFAEEINSTIKTKTKDHNTLYLYLLSIGWKGHYLILGLIVLSYSYFPQ